MPHVRELDLSSARLLCADCTQKRGNLPLLNLSEVGKGQLVDKGNSWTSRIQHTEGPGLVPSTCTTGQDGVPGPHSRETSGFW